MTNRYLPDHLLKSHNRFEQYSLDCSGCHSLVVSASFESRFSIRKLWLSKERQSVGSEWEGLGELQEFDYGDRELDAFLSV